MFLRGNFWRKVYQVLSLSPVFTKFLFNLICKGETERYANQVLTLFLTTFVWHNFGFQSGYPRDTENKVTLCIHLGTLGPVQPPKDLHRSIVYAPGSQ